MSGVISNNKRPETLLRTGINPTPSDFKETALNHVLVAKQCKLTERVICYEGAWWGKAGGLGRAYRRQTPC